jgi:hypothetical protein
MQTLDLEDFTNSSNWHVKHNGDSGMYTVRSEKGHTLPGVFTMRKLAEAHLLKYLSDVEKSGKPKRKQMKATPRTPAKGK